MKTKRRIAAVAIALVMSWVMPAFAQEGGTGAETTLKQRFQKDDRLISELIKSPEDAPESIRAQLIELRQSQIAIRNEWIENYRPGDNATAEEIKAARDRFQEELSEEIRASRELRSSLMRELRAGVRDAVDDATWNEQARAIYAEYQSSQAALGEAWRAVRAELGEDATREEVKAAKERFNEANADLIAQQKELAKQVRDLIRENREERLTNREELPEALKDLRSDMAALRDQVRSRQRQAREEMLDLSKEERDEYRRNLLEDLKELHDEIKERRRQVIDEIRNGESGDRRPEG